MLLNILDSIQQLKFRLKIVNPLAKVGLRLGFWSCCLLGSIVSTTSLSLAGSPAFTITPSDDANTLKEHLGLDLKEIEDKINSDIDKTFGNTDPQTYLKLFAKAQGFAGKSLGADYASNPTLFVVGAAGNVGVALGDKGLNELKADTPRAGVGASAAFLGGLNLGIVGLKELTLYLNFFKLSKSFNVPVNNISSKLNFDLSSFGIHGQYKLFRPSGSLWGLLIQWGGIDLTTGFNYTGLTLSSATGEITSEFELKGNTNLPTSINGVNLPAVDNTAKISFPASGKFSLKNSAISIPLEVTTNLRILYLLTLFTGAGLDFQIASSTADMDLRGKINAKLNAVNRNLYLGEAAIKFNETARSLPLNLYGIAGAQLNIWVLKLFVQANLKPMTAASLGFGLRVAW